MALRLFHFMAWFSIISGTTLILLTFFWYNYPYKHLTIQEEPFQIANPKVKAGGILTYISTYCKTKNIPITTSREFVNGLIYSVPDTTTNRPLGCHTINISVVIPEELPSGVYHLHNSYRYNPNPIRTITIVRESEPFEIVNEKLPV